MREERTIRMFGATLFVLLVGLATLPFSSQDAEATAPATYVSVAD